MFEYILFDFDGTVFDTVEGISKSVRYAINRFGIDAELEELRCFAGPPLKDMFRDTFHFSEDEAQQAVDYFRERYVPEGIYECSVFPGIKDLLYDLKCAGKKTGIATSKPQNLATLLLERENMTGLFDIICGSTPGKNDESKALVLSKTMDILHVDRDSTVLVGDTKYDILGAKACGIANIGVRYGYAAPGELELAGADLIVGDMTELRSALLDE